LSARYEIAPGDDGASYRFTTISGLTYIAYFTEFFMMNEDQEEITTYSFGFTCDRMEDIQRHDTRVKQTIIYIIQDFFDNQPEDVLLYMCMTDDGRARNRHIAFGRWFRDVNESLEKHNFTYRDDNSEFYSSILLKTTNPNKKRFIDAFYFTNQYWAD